MEQHYIGKMDRQCPYCRLTPEGDNPALYFPNEKISSLCCSNGDAILLPLQSVPELEKLITSEETRKDYLDNLREMNSSLAMMSFGVTLEMPPSRGPWVFRIHGQTYHRIGPLLPPDNKAPSYASLYIIDPREALKERLKRQENQNINSKLLEKLQNYLAKHNPYVRSFRHMYEILQTEERFVIHVITNTKLIANVKTYI